MPEVAPDDIDNEEIDEPRRESSLSKHLREQSEQSLIDYLQQLAGESPIKVTVIRERPKSWQGRNIDGTLETHDEPLSEEDIKELYGGGKFKLMISAPDSKGSYRYKASKRITIAGDPKLDGLITTSANAVKETDSPSVVLNAMRMAQIQAERAEERAERAEMRRARPPEDGALPLLMEEMRIARMESAEKDRRLLELATSKDSTQEDRAFQLVLEEMRMARMESAEKDRKMLEIVSKPQGSSVAETLLSKAIEGESARIQAMQVQHDSELRMRADMHRAEIDRLHARYEDIARRQEEAHKREIDNLRQSVDNQISMLKVSYEGQIAGYQREIATLDRELNSAKTEASELRARKERGLLESITEMAVMKEAMESFTGASDKKEEGGSAIERIIQSALGSSLAEGIAARLAGGPESLGLVQNPAREEPEMPIGQPVRTPDGRVLVRQPDGRVLQLRQRARPQQPTGESVSEPSAEDIAMILPFMESALANDSDPAEFVRTARSLAPAAVSGAVKELIQAQGADAFLELVAKARPESSLLQQHGKNWTRKVAAILLE